MKKTYQTPSLAIIRLNTELPMATSTSLGIFDETAGGSEALSNEESNINVWDNGGNGSW